MEFVKQINAAEVNSLPLKVFEGEIYLIDDCQSLKKHLKALNSHRILGFDTETRPSFKKGKNNAVALLQLSTLQEAYLIRLTSRSLCSELIKILENPEIVKVGAAIRDDIKALQDLKKFIPHGFVDLQDVARANDFKSFSLKKLAAIFLGFRISKSQQLSNWEAPELTEPQQRYAATDAWVAAKIYNKVLNNGLHQKDNTN